MTRKTTQTSSPERTEPHSTRLGRLMVTASLPMLAFFLVPLTALFLRTTPIEFLANLAQPAVTQAMALSLVTTTTTTLLTVVFGTPLAYALAYNSFRYQHLVDTLIDLPTVLPPAVAGVALLMAFGRRGVIGGLLEQLGWHIAFTPLAVVMAQTFIAAPLFIKSASLGFASIDRELEQAASLDGANWWQTFRYVVVPLSWSSLLGGSLMTWARAMGEFGATIIFAGNYPGRTQTMPLAIYIGFEIDLDVALTLSVLLVFFAFAALVTIKRILARTPA